MEVETNEGYQIGWHILENPVWCKRLREAGKGSHEFHRKLNGYIICACRELKIKPTEADKSTASYHVWKKMGA